MSRRVWTVHMMARGTSSVATCVFYLPSKRQADEIKKQAESQGWGVRLGGQCQGVVR